MSPERRSTLLVTTLSGDVEPRLLARAAQVATAAGLEIFLYLPLPEGASHRDTKHDSGDAAVPPQPPAPTGHRRLERALALLRQGGAKASGRVEMQRSPARAILVTADARDAAFVMLSPKPHGRIAVTRLADDDFELMRRSRVPLWFVRHAPAHRSALLAAVDPSSTDTAVHALNEAVLNIAVDMARRLRLNIHALHAFELPLRHPGVLEAAAPRIVHARQQESEDYQVKRMHELVAGFGIDKAHVHIGHGDLIKAIESLVTPLNVDVIVVGALPTGHLSKLFVGGTTERIVATIDADVLIVAAPVAPPAGRLRL